ncbi:3-keto-5-aminohexanoate cleavage protein [Bradyrhizobium yuanmingense]|uniref:3-keto-5-aminohexanoate cleavage protein n=1 Tax=Bradyrhizobium yuanmingense TaxID=108015 RepID=UPI0030B90B41
MLGELERLVHVEGLRPEIFTLDCGSLVGKAGELVMVNTIATLRIMAARLQELGVKPEFEVFDIGQLFQDLVKEGLIDGSPLIQICMVWATVYRRT